MYFGALRIAAARVDIVLPEGVARSVRFAIQEIQIMLADKERRTVDRVRGRRRCVVIQDRHLSSVRGAQADTGAGGIGKREIYCLVAFNKVVIHDQDPEGLAGLAWIERDGAERNFVIALLGSVPGL